MRLTRRGKIVVGIAAILAVAGLWEVVTHLWWVGDKYCWGTMTQCLVGANK